MADLVSRPGAARKNEEKSDRQGHVVKGRRGLMKRLFLGLIAAALMASAFVGSTTAVMAQTKTLKMQATWPASLTLYDNFTYFAERVNKLSAGTLKIEAMPAGQVVPAVRGAGRDPQEGARRRACVGRLLDRQEQDRDPVHRRSRRHLRHGLHGRDGLVLSRRRPRALQRVLPEGAQAQRRRVPHPACRAAGVRLVQEADPDGRGHEGHEMPPDRHGRRSRGKRSASRWSTCRAARSFPPHSAA